MRVLGRGGGGGGEGVLGVPRQVRRLVASIGWAGCHPPYQDQNCICVSEFGCTNMCTFVLVCISICDTEKAVFRLVQGGRTWQAFGGGKHGHETYRQARNYNFCDKCVIFARNRNFSNLTQ